MKTRNQLERENSELKEKLNELTVSLETEKTFNKAIKEATEKGMLPLKGIECTGCKHCFVFVYKRRAFAIACRKDVDCKDFEKSEWTVSNYAEHTYGTSRFIIDPDEIYINNPYAL